MEPSRALLIAYTGTDLHTDTNCTGWSLANLDVTAAVARENAASNTLLDCVS